MKKTLLTLATLCMACVLCVAEVYHRGDVNGDGRVSIEDVSDLVSVIKDGATVKGNTDVNLDSKKTPDVNDVNATVKIILGTQEEDMYLMNYYQAKYISAKSSNGYPTLNNKDARLCHVVTTAEGSTITIKGATTAEDYTLSGLWDIVPCTDGFNILKADDHTQALMFNQDKGTCCFVDTLAEYYNADLAIWKVKTPAEYSEYTAKKRFTAAALNVDGMPKEIDLGITSISLNPDAKEEAGGNAIGTKLKTMGWDFIGVSEDFNYHSNIWDNAWNDGVDDENGEAYNATTHAGDITLSSANLTNYVSKKPLFTTDGLCLFHKVNSIDHQTLMDSEKRVAWNDHYGYTDHGADGLITKGYRFYVAKLTDGTEIDVYILHMDADSEEADNAARESQLKQLVSAIIASDNKRPIIVIGDTNCRYTRDRVKTCFIEALNSDSRFQCKDPWIEFGRDGKYPRYGADAIMAEDKSLPGVREGMAGFLRGEVVDKCFYINNRDSKIWLTAESYHQDMSFIDAEGEPLADHWPCVVEFSYHQYDPNVDGIEVEEKDENDLSGTYYLRNVETGKFLKAGGWWGTHAVQGNYGTEMDMELSGDLADGKYTLESNFGGLSSENNDPYMNKTATEWTLVQNGAYYSLTYDNNGTTMALTGNDVTTFPTKPGPNTRYVTCAAYNASDNYQKWELVTKKQLELEMQSASADNPVNCTYLLPGANFDSGDDTGNKSWDGEWPTSATRMTSNKSNGKLDFAYGNACAEIYVSACDASHITTLGSCKHQTKWDIYQNLTNMPAGKYKVTCQAFQRISNSTSTTAKINLRANNDSTQIMLMYNEKKITDSSFGGTTLSGGYYYPNSMAEATLYFNAGYFMNEVTTTVSDSGDGTGTLFVSIAKWSDTGKDNSAWTCFDNFQIYYLGPSE